MTPSRMNRNEVVGPAQREDWFLKLQGEATEVFRKINFSKIPPRVVRGRIMSFSRQARMRMLRYVAHVNWPAIGKSLLVTLTYPDCRVREAMKIRSMHRSLFFRYAEKFLGHEVSALWRVEWKPRLSGKSRGLICPHYHLLLCGVRFLPRRQVRTWWRKILDVKGPLCTDVQGVDGDAGVARYCAKYMAKASSLDRGTYQSNPDPLGRQWGVRRKKGIPTHPIAILRQITEAEVEWCKMVACGVLPQYDAATGGGFTLLGREYADRFLDEFEEAG